MTAADGGAGSGARPGRRWDVALSFAGTERDYVGQVAEATRGAEPTRGEPTEALERVLLATWDKLGNFHALLAINTSRLSAKELHRRHLPVMTQFVPLIERGQEDGVFRRDLPVSWHLAVIRALVHAASAELQSGRLSEAEVEATIVTTVLAAMRGPTS